MAREEKEEEKEDVKFNKKRVDKLFFLLYNSGGWY